MVLLAPGGVEGLFKKTWRPVVDAASPIPPLGDEEKHRIAQFAPEFGIELKTGGNHS
ncbi:MAG: hypothetical protein ACRC1K_02535 [Planctomycetia bacterium]